MSLRLAAAVVLGTILLVGCAQQSLSDEGQNETDPSSSVTPAASSTPKLIPTPIEDFPEKHDQSKINFHTKVGKWAFVSTPTADSVGVMINGLWQGQPGALGSRQYTQPTDGQIIDVNLAVPFYLSWSYVILSGDGESVPEPIVLPNSKGSLYNVTSPFSDHDCPDYQPIEATGIGFRVTHCAVSISGDGAFPIGLAFPVPNQPGDYWFLDAPTAAFI